MELKPKKGYKRVVDNQTSLIHYIPQHGRLHEYDRCWCNPIISTKDGALHHYYMKTNKAECEK